MEKIYKMGEELRETVEVGDIIEIKSGVFIKVKSIKITEEDLAGTKKTNVYLMGEIVSNGR